MLSTDEASVLLKADGIDLSSEQVAELARNQVFPGASKFDGRWTIPAEDLAAFIGMRRRKSRRTRWITAGTVGLVIAVLGLFSIAKDTLDLARDYILPTPTPSIPACTVAVPEGQCIPLLSEPFNAIGQVMACLPNGTRVEVLDMVQGVPVMFYRIGSYVDDMGPVVVTQVLPNTPAEKVGLREGDVVLRFDDVVLGGTVIREWRDYVGGKVDQPINMLIERNGRRITLRPVPQGHVNEEGAIYGSIGYNYQGGVRQKGYGGYIPTMWVSCGPLPTPSARP